MQSGSLTAWRGQPSAPCRHIPLQPHMRACRRCRVHAGHAGAVGVPSMHACAAERTHASRTCSTAHTLPETPPPLPSPAAAPAQDDGGEAFKALSKAYETLADRDARHVYDSEQRIRRLNFFRDVEVSALRHHRCARTGTVRCGTGAVHGRRRAWPTAHAVRFSCGRGRDERALHASA